jgi:DNA recombination protein RmuC
MTDYLVLAVLIVLCVLLLVTAVGLWRLTSLASAREDDARGALRDGLELRAKLDALTTQMAHGESDIRQDLANTRHEHATTASGLRTEVSGAIGTLRDTTRQQLTDMRTEFGGAIAKFRDMTQQQLTDMAGLQQRQLQGFAEQLTHLTLSSEQRLEAVRLTVEQRLDALRIDNTAKLDQMRATVDEKLQATLEQRLGASFKIVSDRLEQVHKGLGEMQTLATGVGDLKRVLANVKTRGGWGEMQLASLLAEILTPQQYEINVQTWPGSGSRVEFAIRLPGREEGLPCWLPIDAKFPLDHWQRLQDALERADAPAADESRKALGSFMREQAKSIRDLYVKPPYTTDFAILFIPTEGLYAEMMARPGFADQLQREYRVMLTGPMNLAALLNSLQMGFRTLAIEQRSSEVWRVLGAVKTEFAKFGDVLAKTKERIDKASEELDRAGVRSRAITRELRKVESLPDVDAQQLLGASLLLDPDDVPPPDTK